MLILVCFGICKTSGGFRQALGISESPQEFLVSLHRTIGWPFGLPLMLLALTLWSKIEKNTDKIAIQSFTVLRAREWAKWASERTSERSGGRERSKQSRASERVSGASEQANGQASGPVLQSVFLAVIDHSAWVGYRGHWLGFRGLHLDPRGFEWVLRMPWWAFRTANTVVPGSQIAYFKIFWQF